MYELDRKLHLVVRLQCWWLWSIPLLPLWSSIVEPIWVSSMPQIDLFENYLYLIGQKKYLRKQLDKKMLIWTRNEINYLTSWHTYIYIILKWFLVYLISAWSEWCQLLNWLIDSFIHFNVISTCLGLCIPVMRELLPFMFIFIFFQLF